MQIMFIPNSMGRQLQQFKDKQKLILCFGICLCKVQQCNPGFQWWKFEVGHRSGQFHHWRFWREDFRLEDAIKEFRVSMHLCMLTLKLRPFEISWSLHGSVKRPRNILLNYILVRKQNIERPFNRTTWLPKESNLPKLTKAFCMNIYLGSTMSYVLPTMFVQNPNSPYSDLPNNHAANFIIFRGNKHLHNYSSKPDFHLHIWEKPYLQSTQPY